MLMDTVYIALYPVTENPGILSLIKLQHLPKYIVVNFGKSGVNDI